MSRHLVKDDGCETVQSMPIVEGKVGLTSARRSTV